jgi:ribosomal protein L11 methyltransferase
MVDYVELQIDTPEQWQKDMVIAQLSEIGFEGFEEEKNRVKAYVPEEAFNEEDCKKVLLALDLAFTKNMIVNRNWNADWESDFKPVVVGDFCVIRANFHAAVTNTKHEIIITPKMSFGTGHHATTFMMIQAMSAMVLANKAIFDFGTGTGVLAILATRMGAKTVTAIDNDGWSIENAAENFRDNNCNGIVLHKAEWIEEKNLFDLILANINRHVILHQLGRIKQHLNKNGVVLLSGILNTDEEKLAEAATNTGLKITDKWRKDDWICLKMNEL